MKLNPTMTVKEYADHQGVSIVTVYDWLKRGMRKCSEGKGRTLRIDPVQADLWLTEWRSGKCSFLAEKIYRLKFALKSQIIPVILAAVLLILATENIINRPRISADNRRLARENTVLTTGRQEMQAVLASQAEMQERYSGLKEIGEALGLDVEAALNELREQNPNTLPPELVLATTIDSAEYFGQWITEQAQADREAIAEFGDRVQATPSGWPVADGKGRVTSGYGWRRRIFRLTNLIDRDGVLYEFHHAVDISAKHGTAIIATAPGEVIAAEWVESYGQLVIVDHGYGYESWYAHLTAFKVAPGDTVERGDVIGLMGDTGSTTGTHLHYEVRLNGVPVNPINYMGRNNND